VINSIRIKVDGEYDTSLAQQVHQVSSVTASGIEHTHSGLDVAAQDLIEDVDIDLAELFLNVNGDRSPGTRILSRVGIAPRKSAAD
jgi:hypothetical protein